jgi:hypothetical protein
MNSSFSRTAVAGIRNIIEQYASRGGLVAMRPLWRDLNSLPLDPVVVQDIIKHLESVDYLWHWGQQMVVVRPFLCPNCNRVIQQSVTAHMHNEHPRPTQEVARVEWVE